MCSQLLKIAVGVCTLNRESALLKLIDSIYQQKPSDRVPLEIALVIVDNSSDGSLVDKYANVRGDDSCGNSATYPTHFLKETRRGLSFARNAALNFALLNRFDFLIFIDDDELPGSLWIEKLVSCIVDTGAAAAIGSVIPVFEAAPSNWIAKGEYYHKKLAEIDGQSIFDGYTSNAIIDLRFIDAHGISFDLNFNFIGGEDTIFFRDMLRQGGRIVWAGGAFVTEFIPKDRMKLSWLLTRWFRTGVVELHLRSDSKKPLRCLFFNIFWSFSRISFGMFRLIFSLVTFGKSEPVVSSMYTLCRGLGMLSSLLGASYGEYSQKRYR